ncbi:MAG: hypothetical protein ACREE4_17760 [Stellaceae bacterium]
MPDHQPTELDLWAVALAAAEGHFKLAATIAGPKLDRLRRAHASGSTVPRRELDRTMRLADELAEARARLTRLYQALKER